jgi:hypothetical protein
VSPLLTTSLPTQTESSDVTWLYDPLHTSSDWIKTPEYEPPPSPFSHRHNISNGYLTVAVLQHSLTRSRASPSSCFSSRPFFHGGGSDLEEDTEGSHNLPDVDEHRPLLLHTKSNSHISSCVKAFRKDPAMDHLAWADSVAS